MAISNVAPKLSVKLHELASNDPHSAEQTKLIHETVIPLYALRAKRKGYEVSAMKALMDELGLVGGKVRPPLVDVKADDMKALRESLPKWREWI